MGGFQEIFNQVTSWTKSFTDFGLTLILALVVVDILFPGSGYVLGNIEGVVAKFNDGGLAGLIALLLFLVLFKR